MARALVEVVRAGGGGEGAGGGGEGAGGGGEGRGGGEGTVAVARAVAAVVRRWWRR